MDGGKQFMVVGSPCWLQASHKKLAMFYTVVGLSLIPEYATQFDYGDN